MENNFLELIDIDSIENTGYQNVVDIAVTGGESFVLSNGIISHNSALSAVRKFRDTQTMGAYPLKGKFLNVSELSNSEVISNKEVKGLMGALGLKLGEEPTGLRYGRIYLYVDADPDGNSIAGQLINFFNKYWPELFDQGRIYKVMTPLVVARKGSTINSFYSQAEFEKWLAKNNPKSWSIEYKKGLAALEDDEYEEIIRNPYTAQLKNDHTSKESLEAWFGRDSQPRKEKILNLNKK